MVEINSETYVEVKRVATIIQSKQNREDFAEAILSQFTFGDKIWLSGLAGRNSALQVVQGTLGYVHPKGRYINIIIDGQNHQESIICVGQMFLEEDIGDSKYLALNKIDE